MISIAPAAPPRTAHERPATRAGLQPARPRLHPRPLSDLPVASREKPDLALAARALRADALPRHRRGDARPKIRARFRGAYFGSRRAPRDDGSAGVPVAAPFHAGAGPARPYAAAPPRRARVHGT